MTKIVKLRRGTTLQHSSFTGSEGELTIDTDKDTAIVHDGSTLGGHELVSINATQRITNKDIVATNLTVSGVSTLSNLTVSGDVGIGTTNPKTSLQVGGVYGIKTGFGTFSSTVGIATDIDTFTISSTDFKTSEYTLFFNNGNNIQALKLLVMQNGSQAYYQEYGSMFEPNQIVSVAASITSGVCKLSATPETGISGITTYKFIRETIL